MKAIYVRIVGFIYLRNIKDAVLRGILDGIIIGTCAGKFIVDFGVFGDFFFSQI